MKAKVKETGEIIDVEQYEYDHFLGWLYRDKDEVYYRDDEFEILEEDNQITEQTLLDFGFVKEEAFPIYTPEMAKDIQSFFLTGISYNEPVRVFKCQNVWMCDIANFVGALEKHPAISEYSVRTKVETIEDVQLAIKVAKIDFELKKKEK